MKHYERRAAGAYPYFKLAVWEPRSFTFKDGKRQHGTEAEARGEAKKPGRYRVSRVEEDGRHDLPPFDVA